MAHLQDSPGCWIRSTVTTMVRGRACTNTETETQREDVPVSVAELNRRVEADVAERKLVEEQKLVRACVLHCLRGVVRLAPCAAARGFGGCAEGAEGAGQAVSAGTGRRRGRRCAGGGNGGPWGCRSRARCGGLQSGRNSTGVDLASTGGQRRGGGERCRSSAADRGVGGLGRGKWGRAGGCGGGHCGGRAGVRGGNVAQRGARERRAAGDERWRGRCVVIIVLYGLKCLSAHCTCDARFRSAWTEEREGAIRLRTSEDVHCDHSEVHLHCHR